MFDAIRENNTKKHGKKNTFKAYCRFNKHSNISINIYTLPQIPTLGKKQVSFNIVKMQRGKQSLIFYSDIVKVEMTKFLSWLLMT